MTSQSASSQARTSPKSEPAGASEQPENSEAAIEFAMTEKAARKVREFLREEELGPQSTYLRVSVLPGGCSGFEYGLELTDEVDEQDLRLEREGIEIVIDPFSAQYLEGTTIGYQSSFQGEGFTFDNPNATGSCGCGSSFAV